MKKTRLLIGALTAAGVAAAFAQGNVVHVMPDQIKWVAGAPATSKSSESFVLSGPIDKPVPYTLRVRIAAGGFVSPHSHPDARHTTILSGELYVGLGDNMDPAKATRYPTGSFVVMPAGQVHYSMANNGDVVYQESGYGPTATNFVKK